MLDLKTVLADLDGVAEKLARRGPDVDLAPLRDQAARRRELIAEVQKLREEQKRANDGMREVAKQGGAALEEARTALRAVSTRIKELDDELREVEAGLEEALLYIPNIPADDVPDGSGEEDNQVLRTWGEKPDFSFPPKTHDEIGAALGILDPERGAKISGARFTVLWGWASRLERALASFMLDLHASRGYREVLDRKSVV